MVVNNMNCPTCSSSNVAVFLDEEITCFSCKEVNTVSISICESCGFIWKSVQGEVIFGSYSSETDASNTINKSITHSMQDLVHKCIMCDNLAFETSPNLFSCSDCGFEWEII
jgi:predicted RNA-binding Zn-ribbon protein involved in translation (DUF1610 family)